MEGVGRQRKKNTDAVSLFGKAVHWQCMEGGLGPKNQVLCQLWLSEVDSQPYARDIQIESGSEVANEFLPQSSLQTRRKQDSEATTSVISSNYETSGFAWT